jgi:hypothetical protein
LLIMHLIRCGKNLRNHQNVMIKMKLELCQNPIGPLSHQTKRTPLSNYAIDSVRQKSEKASKHYD